MLNIKKILTKILTKGDYRELLWTNSSTAGTGFPSQTVSLDLSAYDAVDIEFSNATSGIYGMIVRVAVGGTGLCVMNGVTSSTIRGRYVEVGSSGNIAFNNGVSGSTSSSTVVIPRRIWGVKLGG